MNRGYLFKPVTSAALGSNGVALGPGGAPGHGPGQPHPSHHPAVLIPDYTAYAGTPSHVANLRMRANLPTCIGSENDLKAELLKRQLICLAQVDPETQDQEQQQPPLPSVVDNFANLVLLEPPPPSPLHKSSTFGYVTSCYKATNTENGQHVCLRRIHGYRLVSTKCMGLVEQWKKLSHANLVGLLQVFTTKSFGDHSMVFVYDFYPGAETLMMKHYSTQAQQQLANSFMDPFSGTGSDGLRPYYQPHKGQALRQQSSSQQQQQQQTNGGSGGGGNNTGLLAESTIWSYIIQLTSALRHIHSCSLACRVLDPTKILVVNKSRLLLNCGGIFDVITYDQTNAASTASTAMAQYQQDDLIALGKIVLALACNSFMAIQRENLQTSLELVTHTYSNDLRNLIMYLLTNPQRVKSVNDLMPMIGARFYTQLDNQTRANDLLEADLSKEVESSRLFLMLTKLCTVVDRAELNGDFGWAEYGDRYMLKLFRDYVFHQVMEDSRPWLDMAHVVSCLNKLDAGLSEKVCLMSRDEQNVLVTSYAELKHCLEQSFGECVSSNRSGHGQAAVAAAAAAAALQGHHNNGMQQHHHNY